MDLTAILSRYFTDRGDFEDEDYLFAYGDPRQALVLFRLFWPQFAQVGGYVVLQSAVDVETQRDVLESRLALGTDERRALLSGFRWLDLSEVFSLSPLDDSDEEALAGLVAETWLGALHLRYPHQKWRTTVLSPSETGGGFGVSFDEMGP